MPNGTTVTAQEIDNHASASDTKTTPNLLNRDHWNITAEDWRASAAALCREAGADEQKLNVDQLVEAIRLAHIHASERAWGDAVAAGKIRGRGLSMILVAGHDEMLPWDIAAAAAEDAGRTYIREHLEPRVLAHVQCLVRPD